MTVEDLLLIIGDGHQVRVKNEQGKNVTYSAGCLPVNYFSKRIVEAHILGDSNYLAMYDEDSPERLGEEIIIELVLKK
ncbi:hypothetical protein EGCR1_04535 [Enterococcus gilvus]|jgi:hypothetical protein|uniref:hypothetical protein n=1 Tax=Enterococcus TaxID=1350 RepID=UPI000DF5DB4F|nr:MULTISPECIES: hypothetical protein [Enterococcus]AXG38011.1 hypothetical protein EGCR1_04535 [Enterococcus gilvus]